jgi:enterochelin esterase-like enzyme
VLCLLLAACSSATPTPSGSSSPTASAPTDTATPTESPSPTATPFVCTEAHGVLHDHSYTSKVSGVKVRYRVYTPPCYETANRSYPYVILFHGSLDDQTEWTDQLKVDEVLDAGLADGTLAPMIVLMPGGGEIANDHVSPSADSYEDVVLDEVIPRFEGQYATWGTRDGREIGGISRGGFWAFSIALRHPDLFAAVGGHSPFFHPDNAAPSSNPLDLIEDLPVAKIEQLRIWVDRGANDYAEPGITPFVRTIEDREIEATVILYPTGKHEVPYWKSHVEEYLDFYGQLWPKSEGELPLR